EVGADERGDPDASDVLVARGIRDLRSLAVTELGEAWPWCCRIEQTLDVARRLPVTDEQESHQRARSAARSGCASNQSATYQHMGRMRRVEFFSTSSTANSTTSPARPRPRRFGCVYVWWNEIVLPLT